MPGQTISEEKLYVFSLWSSCETVIKGVRSFLFLGSKDLSVLRRGKVRAECADVSPGWAHCLSGFLSVPVGVSHGSM